MRKIQPTWILIITTPLFMASLWYFRFLPKVQFEVGLLASLTYLTVALLHHLKDKSLTSEVVIEYVLLAALAVIILQSILL